MFVPAGVLLWGSWLNCSHFPEALSWSPVFIHWNGHNVHHYFILNGRCCLCSFWGVLSGKKGKCVYRKQSEDITAIMGLRFLCKMAPIKKKTLFKGKWYLVEKWAFILSHFLVFFTFTRAVTFLVLNWSTSFKKKHVSYIFKSLF